MSHRVQTSGADLGGIDEAELRRRLHDFAAQITLPPAGPFRPRRRLRWWTSLWRSARPTQPRRPKSTTDGSRHEYHSRPALRRILVVEDDPATRQVIIEALRDDGFDVVAAQDGLHALRLAAVSHPDLIVLDLGLPLLDGPSFAARWHERSDANVPIVVVSGRPDAPAAARTMHAAGFCRKPLDLAALAALIRASYNAAQPIGGSGVAPE